MAEEAAPQSADVAVSASASSPDLEVSLKPDPPGGGSVGGSSGDTGQEEPGYFKKGGVRGNLKNSIWSSLTGGKSDEVGGGGERDRWSSRVAFFFAAIGSAVGFGNVWRFPSLAADFGGGAFLIPYLMALFLIGIPILTLEIALGQFHQTGDVGVFGSIHRRLRGVGLTSIACSYMLVCYYAMLLAWVCNAFFATFASDAAWRDGTQLDGDAAVGSFLNDVVGMSTMNGIYPTRIVWENVGYSLLVWFTVWVCIAWGLKTTGRITYFTMGLPIILLFVFLGRAVSLPGSSDGIHMYIGVWDLSVLVEQPEVWSEAVSQIFFSLSVTFGVMTAYGSHCKRTEPAFVNSCVIATCNCLFSFIAGFAVFASVGYLAYLDPEKSVEDISYKSFSLVFGTWPVVLSTLPGGIHWVRLFYLMLFLLGIDSAFSLMEAAITVVMDSVRFHKSDRRIISCVMCMAAWLIGWMYATDAGLIFLDTIDFYINFVMIIVGFLETFAAGWIYGLEEQVQSLGKTIVSLYMFANFGAVILACGLWFGLKNGNAVWAGFVGLVLFYAVFMCPVVFLLKGKMAEDPDRWMWRSILWALVFKNVFDLKNDIEPVVRRIPAIWCILMKHLIPHLLLILFVNLATAKTATGESKFGHYEGYPMKPYQILGILCVAFVLILFLVGAAAPDAYECLQIPKETKEVESQDESDSSPVAAYPEEPVMDDQDEKEKGEVA